MKEFADRPLRVTGEPQLLHLWRLLRWLLELRLVPRLREQPHGRWRWLYRSWFRESLTRTGKVLFVCATLLLLLSLRGGDQFLLTSAALGLSLLLWSICLGAWYRPRVELRRLGEAVAVAGRPLQLPVELHNRGRTLLDFSVRELKIPGLRTPRDSAADYHERLESGARLRTHTEVLPLRRGLLDLPGVAVQSYFPFFLTRRCSRHAAPAQVPVLPEPLAAQLPPLRRTVARQQALMEGERHRGRTAGVLEYRDSRPFTAGDSTRRIDHRASARRGEIMSKVFDPGQGSEVEGVALACDLTLTAFQPWQRRPKDSTPLDRRLALMVALAHSATAEGLPVRALALGPRWQALDDINLLWSRVAACGAVRGGWRLEPPAARELLVLLAVGDVAPAHLQWLGECRARGQRALVFSRPETDHAAPPPDPGCTVIRE